MREVTELFKWRAPVKHMVIDLCAKQLIHMCEFFCLVFLYYASVSARTVCFVCVESCWNGRRSDKKLRLESGFKGKPLRCRVLVGYRNKITQSTYILNTFWEVFLQFILDSFI